MRVQPEKKRRVQGIIAEINQVAGVIERPLLLMEVCGTHTVAIAQSGIRDLLPANIRLLSGPGCPVCVTDTTDLDAVINLAERPGVILATYGDLIRVPGSASTLQEKRSQGANVQVVYSALEALQIAERNPQAEVVMAGIGFETTAPATAVVVELAQQKDLRNFSVFSLHKVVPPALRALLTDPGVNIDAFINPGHVCTILGVEPFLFVAEEFNRPCVVAGFEPIDILEAILMILKQYLAPSLQVEIQYRRAVRPEGNQIAQGYLERFFQPVSARWRGLGIIPSSGLGLRPEFAAWDTEQKLPVQPAKTRPTAEKKGPVCWCGAILKGQKNPGDCPSFGQACTPLRPVGPCMVSTEGACAAHYRFGVGKNMSSSMKGRNQAWSE